MKLLGLLSLVICGAYAGNAASAALRRNEISCRKVRCFLDELAILMRCTCASLSDLMEELMGKEYISELNFPGTVCNELRKGVPFPDAWNKGIKEDRQLSAPLRELLLSLSDSLGASDLEGQLMNIERTTRQLGFIQENALESYRTKGRLYRCLGVLGGISAALLLC